MGDHVHEPVPAGQPELAEAGLLEIVGRVRFEKQFRVGKLGDGFFVQIEYDEPDVITGDAAVQRGRKWYVSRFATESEVVQTMLRAAIDSAEHQVREHFFYRAKGAEKARAIYGPHFSADALYGICGTRENYDARADPE